MQEESGRIESAGDGVHTQTVDIPLVSVVTV